MIKTKSQARNKTKVPTMCISNALLIHPTKKRNINSWANIVAQVRT
jgi:hypothetical protein